MEKNVDVPMLEVIRPGARAAVGATTLSRIGVIGTRATIASDAYAEAIAAVDPAVEVVSAACPLFVPMVEEGRTSGTIVKAVAEEYLRPLLAKHIDTLILGCTHYPVLKPALQEVVGGGVTLVDSAEAVATAATELLAAGGGARAAGETPPRFYVTDTPGDFEDVARFIWPDWPGRAVRVEIGRTWLR